MIVLPSAEETRLLAVERRYERFDRELRDLARDIRRLQQGLREAGDIGAQPGGGLLFTVKDCSTGAVLAGAEIDVKVSGVIVTSGLTKSDGTYFFLLSPGTYDADISLANYSSVSPTGLVVARQSVTTDSECLTPSAVLTDACPAAIPFNLGVTQHISTAGATLIANPIVFPITYQGFNSGTNQWVWSGCSSVSFSAGSSCSAVTTFETFTLTIAHPSGASALSLSYPITGGGGCPASASCGGGGLTLRSAVPTRLTSQCAPYKVTFNLSAPNSIVLFNSAAGVSTACTFVVQ